MKKFNPSSPARTFREYLLITLGVIIYAFGIVGIETAFPAMYTHMVLPGIITLERLIEMLTTMILIYGMLIVRKETGNAWGCVLIFFVYWNAL